MDFKAALEPMHEEILRVAKELIQIKSVQQEEKDGMPFGEGVAKALEKSVKIMDEFGFRTKNVENYAAYGEIGEGEEMIGILAHMDVVPEGDGWTVCKPYEPVVEDGKLFGRGSLDDKGPVAAAMIAMKILKDSNVKLNKRIRLILGGNEENGSGCMHYYKKHEELPTFGFTPDADFPAIHAEKGIMIFNLKKEIKETSDIKILSLKGGNAPNMVADRCKLKLDKNKMDIIEKEFEAFKKESIFEIDMKNESDYIEISAIGKSAHGSTPWLGQSAISIMMAFLDRIKSHLGKDLEMFVDYYNKSIGFETDGSSTGCGFSDEPSGKLVFNVGMVNIKDDEAKLIINVRYPVTLNQDKVYDGLKSVIKNYDINVEPREHDDPIYIPKDHEVIRKLMKSYKDVTKDEKAEPVVIGGGTYARDIQNIVAFGPVFPGSEETAHQSNEYITLKDLFTAAEIYLRALYELAQ